MRIRTHPATLALLLAATGCQSSFRIDVAIFNGPINEYRQAQDADQAALQLTKAFTTISQYSKPTGLDDGTIATDLALAVSEADAAVLASRPGTSFESELSGPNGTKALIYPGLVTGISKETSGWPSSVARQAMMDKVTRDAQAMKEAANALMHQYQSSSATSAIALQAGFSRARNQFNSAEEEARTMLDRCSNVINSLTNLVAGTITPDVLATLREKGSQFQQLKLGLITLDENNGKIAKAAYGAMKRLDSMATLATRAHQATADAEASSRLVNYDASVDLSDPNWRYLADAPEENWRTFQHLSTRADGSANYIIIQEGMGDFRLKKLFNDPTEGYKAGVQIGQKVFQTAASAAIAAMSGGAGAALTSQKPAASGTTTATQNSQSSQDSTSALNSTIAQNDATLAILKTNRAIVNAQIQLLVSDLSGRKAPANPITAAYLLSVSNRLDALKGILQPTN